MERRDEGVMQPLAAELEWRCAHWQAKKQLRIEQNGVCHFERVNGFP